jgi:hypothetical protein
MGVCGTARLIICTSYRPLGETMFKQIKRQASLMQTGGVQTVENSDAALGQARRLLPPLRGSRDGR